VSVAGLQRHHRMNDRIHRHTSCPIDLAISQLRARRRRRRRLDRAAPLGAHNEDEFVVQRTSVDERPFEHGPAATRDHAWIPAPIISKLRAVITGYLDGRRDVNADVESLAEALATAAHDASYTPERMLIAFRALWRDFTLSQHDRLQLASLYDRLVRRTIDRYYED
jgi:hypothetical protein